MNFNGAMENAEMIFDDKNSDSYTSSFRNDDNII
jgi:hypothetical protein